MLEAPIHNEGVSVINIYILSSKCFLKTEPKKKKIGAKRNWCRHTNYKDFNVFINLRWITWTKYE